MAKKDKASTPVTVRLNLRTGSSRHRIRRALASVPDGAEVTVEAVGIAGGPALKRLARHAGHVLAERGCTLAGVVRYRRGGAAAT